MIWQSVVIVVLLGACQQGGEPKLSAAECSNAVDALVKTVPSGETPAVRAGLVARCRDNKWTSTTVSCMTNTMDARAQRTCWDHNLTHEQVERLEIAAVLAKEAEFNDVLCDCGNDECATRVGDDITKWSQDLTKQLKPAKMNDVETKRIEEIMTVWAHCMGRAMVKYFLVEPDHGDAGTRVVITSNYLRPDDGKTAKVYFGDKPATVISLVRDELTVEVPAGIAGGDVEVVLELQGIARQERPHGFRFVHR